MFNVAPYRKFVVAIGAVVALAVVLTADGTLSAQDAFALGLEALAAFGVYGVANKPQAEVNLR